MGEAELSTLIEGCLRQSRADQKMLYKTFYGFAMSICLRYANNRYEASEIMNQGFLKVFTNLHKYDETRPFKAWVGRIMMNTSIDYYRSNLKVAFMEDIDTVPDIGHEELPDRRLSYNDLLAMIQQLPNAYRTVFNLFAIEGYSHEEIAKKLNISAGTSKSNLFKAREKLKSMIIKAELYTRSNPAGSNDHFASVTAVCIGVPFLINMIMK